MADDSKKAPSMKDGLVKRGSTWSYVVKVRNPKTGKKTNRMVGGFATRDEARIARDDARADANKGTAVAASKITVAEYLEAWLEGYASQVRPTTHRGYAFHVRNYIVPRIGAERLQQLTPMMVGQLYAVLQREGGQDRHKLKEGESPKRRALSASTVGRVRATLHRALADAVVQRLIPYNPSDAVRAPKVEQHADGAGEMQVWTREELDQFLASCATDRLFSDVAPCGLDGHAARRGGGTHLARY